LVELAHAPTPALARVHYQRIEKSKRRFLVSTTSPNLKLYIERGLCVTPGSRKRYPRQTIFLDGVFNDAPFLDNESRQYSLDHHAGCLRPFTLATCEQSAVMLLQGLPLEEGEWHIYVNEPDLDALLAAWILLNHADLRRKDGELLQRVMPFIRLEGVIDAHGLQRTVLAGLPPDVYRVTKEVIDELMSEELQLRAQGMWSTTDVLEYAHRTLERIDRSFFPEGYLTHLLESEMIEVARAPIQQRRLAVLCRSSRGIYNVEAELKLRYEKQLGVIILDQGDGRFTLRQVDPFLTRSLAHAFKLLNREDPGVSRGDMWGGSADIGGSPRRNGTRLSGEAILGLIAEEYGEGGWVQRSLRRILALRWWRRWRKEVLKLTAPRR
jgi:hypothetical protein